MSWWIGPLLYGAIWGILTFGIVLAVLISGFSGSSRAKLVVMVGIVWAIIHLIVAVAGIAFEHIPMKGGYVATGWEARLCGVESLIFGSVLLLVSIISLKKTKQQTSPTAD